ncbi:MAG TPA: hypothetical protein DCR14_20770, partial [Acidimicrobiaceae bacterium]|nr:hypothetical protein [Acidimicrobiaceae bacterium]
RNGVAVPTDGGTASLELTVDAAGWAALVTAGATCARLVDDGHASVVGGTAADIDSLLRCFDLPEPA